MLKDTLKYDLLKYKSNTEIESVMVFYGNSYGETKYDYTEIYSYSMRYLY